MSARAGAVAALAGVLAMLPLAAETPARGSFPGTNGGFVVVRPWTGADGVARKSLVTTDRNGVTVRRLDRTRRNRLSEPDWSPSGAWVAYVRGTGYRHRTDQVRIVRADGAGRKTIRRAGYFDYPVWSPTGHRIAFWGGNGGSALHIATMLRDGTHGQLVLVVPSVRGMDWSSRNLLAFAGDLADTQRGLFTVHPDGSGLRQLLSSGHKAVPFDPDWSPGGGRLVYVQGRWRSESLVGHGPICTIRADGTANTSLGVSGSEPTWSPDGSQITYISDTDGALHTVAADGTGDVVIGTPGRPASGVDWRPR